MFETIATFAFVFAAPALFLALGLYVAYRIIRAAKIGSVATLNILKTLRLRFKSMLKSRRPETNPTDGFSPVYKKGVLIGWQRITPPWDRHPGVSNS